MGTQTLNRRHQHAPKGVPTALIMIGLTALFALVIVLLVLGSRLTDPTVYGNQFQPVAYTGNGMTSLREPIGIVFIENTDLVYLNDGQGHSGWRLTAVHQSYEGARSSLRVLLPGSFQSCWANERYITVLSAETRLCFDYVPMPPIEVLTQIPFEFSDTTVATAVAARPANTIFIPSDARRAPGTGIYFNDGRQIYYLIWVAGDCTPRILDGNGGYWQMPVEPFWQSTWDGTTYGPGYLVYLPTGWQETWRRNPAEAAQWRLCGGSQFGGQ